VGSGRRGLGWGRGRFPLPFGFFPPNMPLDLVLDGDEEEDPSLAIMDAIEEDFHRKLRLHVLRPNVGRSS
jgi:hypothetical protein